MKGEENHEFNLYLFWYHFHDCRFYVCMWKRTSIHFSSWKNMPQEEKEKIKIVPLCRNIGEVIALNGLIFLLKGLWTGFENHWFVTAMVAWFIVAGFDLWYIEKSDRYYKK